MSSLPDLRVGQAAASYDQRQVRVLLLDIDGEPADELRKNLERHADIHVASCSEPDAVFEVVRHVRPTVILQTLSSSADAGLPLLETLRAADDCRDVPIIVLSSSDETEIKNAAFLAGANDFLVERTGEFEMISRVRYHSSSYHAHRDLRSTADELEKAQGQMLQSEKMACMGLLAAGVAHEINNPIAFITSNLNSLGDYHQDVFSILDAYAAIEDRLTETGIKSVDSMKQSVKLREVREDLTQIITECQDGLSRVRKIVENLKSFSRKSEPERKRADLHKELDSALDLATNELKYKVEVVREYGDLPAVHCIPTQISQVFLNLIVNAAHAIEDRGRITISTALAEAPADLESQAARDSDWVRIEVSDTGCGFDAETAARIFEPFFTTKEIGKGTGLGLSVSHGIVQDHGGHISVVSEIGKGTTFIVCLPVERGADGASTDHDPTGKLQCTGS